MKKSNLKDLYKFVGLVCSNRLVSEFIAICEKVLACENVAVSECVVVCGNVSVCNNKIVCESNNRQPEHAQNPETLTGGGIFKAKTV